MEFISKLYALIDYTVYAKPKIIDDFFDNVETVVNLPSDQLKFFVLMAIAYPLAYFHSTMKNVTLKHFLSFFYGLTIIQSLCGRQYIFTVAVSLISYLMMIVLPRRLCPKVVILFNMACLTSVHIYRYLYDFASWRMDISGSLMVTVIKLSSLAYNYSDGTIDLADNQHKADDPDRKDKAVYKRRIEYSIKELPSLIEYLGYVFYFPTCVAGPAVEYKIYIDGMEYRFSNNQIPGKRVYYSMQALGYCLICAVLYLIGAVYFPVEKIISPEYLKLSGIKYFLLFFPTFSLNHRSKYFLAWYLVEGCSIMGGVGFSGYDKNGEPVWNEAKNCFALSFEIPTSIKDSSRAWNIRTQVWLENYVYSRNGNSMMAVYLTSSFWHGVYSGYYLFFISIAICQNIERIKYKKIWPKIKDNKMFVKIYNFVAFFMTLSMTNYLSVSFALLTLESSWLVWKKMKFGGHIAFAVVYLVSVYLVKADKKEKKE